MSKEENNLREEFKIHTKTFEDYGVELLADRISDFWLNKFSTHTASLVSQIEEKKFPQVESYGDGKYGWNNALDVALKIIKKEE